MLKLSRTFAAAALFAGLTQSAFAKTEDEAPPTPDPSRPAIGEWTGHVSWNEPIVSYAWEINPGGAFSSGRLGRGYTGGGAWGANGSHLTLKYADGFRYEGEIRENSFAGTAYRANGAPFGGFAMWRHTKRTRFTEGDEE